VGQQGHYRDQPGQRSGADRISARVVQDGWVRASGADLLGVGNKGVPGVKAAYAASKAGVSSLGESLRAEYAKGPIRVTVIEPGYIESEMTAKSASTMLMVDNESGVRAMVDAIERERGKGHRPELAVVAAGAIAEGAAPRFTGPSPEGLECGTVFHAVVTRTFPLGIQFRAKARRCGRAPCGSGAPGRRSSCRLLRRRLLVVSTGSSALGLSLASSTPH